MASHWEASDISRRGFLGGASALALLTAGCSPSNGGGTASTSPTPVDGLPAEAEWAALREQVGGRLIDVESPLTSCTADVTGDTCSAVLENRTFYDAEFAIALLKRDQNPSKSYQMSSKWLKSLQNGRNCAIEFRNLVEHWCSVGP